MASPQPDQFTKLSNELLEALMTVKMSGSEWQYVMCIFRKTYGYNKKEDWITNSQVVKMTGLPKERVSEAKKRLLARKIVTENRNKIAIQKDYEQWIELRKNVTTVTENRNNLLRKSVNTKEKKETITKETSEPSSGINKKVMSWNKRSDDYEEGVVDLDGDGSVHDPVAAQKKEDKERNAKFRESINWLIKHQGRDPNRTSIPKQLKAILKLYTMGVSANEAKQIIIECEGSDIWRGKQEKPDFWTVVSIIQKRG